MSAATAYPRTYSLSDLRVGDEIAYVGARKHRAQRLGDPRDGYPMPVARDWLRVVRIDENGAHGYRVSPLEWERGLEFVVVPLQIEAHGVEVRRV